MVPTPRPMEGPETDNNIPKHVNKHGYEEQHLGGTDVELWVNDLVPQLVRQSSAAP
jgi:hypothetical protein